MVLELLLLKPHTHTYNPSNNKYYKGIKLQAKDRGLACRVVFEERVAVLFFIEYLGGRPSSTY
jgi:hypothetical protein